MTKEQAIKELTRCAEICPTTPLAEACRMAVTALGESRERVGRELGNDCTDCKHGLKPLRVYPCSVCHVKHKEPPLMWESKEVDNEQDKKS